MGVGGTLPRLGSNGGRKPAGAAGPRSWAAVALAIAALSGCTTLPAGGASDSVRAAYRSQAGAGVDLYESGEFVLAGRRFQQAAALAAELGDSTLERKATTAECLSWLRARLLEELGTCSRNLERLQRRERRPDPGVNTLIALGAIADGRPLPPLKLPNVVKAVVHASTREER